MSELTLYKDTEDGNTVISNCFIDEYLADANDAQIKVYLYLTRMMNANRATSITDIADKFNHTEKDVCRSLHYWEQKGLLSLDYDQYGNINGIRLFSPKSIKSHNNKMLNNSPSFTPFVTLMPSVMNATNTPAMQKVSAVSTAIPAPSMNDSATAIEKPSYSLDDLKAFKSREDTAQILFIAEQYLKKTLSANDIRSILFITDYLHFSEDLIDYLLQYCVQRDKKDFRYIEKVAINWAEENITTPKEAKRYSSKYDKSVYTIMNALGKSSAPTPKEVDFIKRWNNELGFTQDIILEACERTVLATDKHRFEYADKILDSWNKAGVHHKKDIEEADLQYKKNMHSKSYTNNKAANTMFHQFQQNDYDFDALEQKLLNRK